MAPSPPCVLSSVTTAATPPPAASMTAAYGVASARPGTARGSTRTEAPGTSGAMVCRVTSAPSAKRYQRAVAEAAPADWMRKGVVHPLGPPRVRVTFGRYARLPTDAPTNAIAVPGLVSASSTANWPPLTTSPYSPSPRHVAVPAAGHAVTPSASTRGSNDHERPAFTAGPVTVSAPGAPSRW